MNTKEISVSIYSFGYAAGFLDDKRPEAAKPVVSIENIAELARRSGLGGIEFPVDRYFPANALEKADAFIANLLKNGMNAVVDLETFDASYIRSLLPVLSKNKLPFVRIKMSGLYGGNRYQEPEFYAWKKSFIKELQSLVPELREKNIMLHIENHQDLTADDLIEIIGATSADCIGINWDIGNALPVLDTPETFLEKAGGFIGNVHLKDYKIYRFNEGFYLSRCALGEGVVDFASLLSTLRKRRGNIPMAIELGAQNARRADVFKKEYWEAYKPYTVSEMTPFLSFLNRNLLDGGNGAWKSAWEQNQSGQSIIESEMKELEQSVTFLKELSLKP